MKETIWINKGQEEVWSFVVLEFAKAFKCSPRQLKTKKMVYKQGPKTITQSIPIQEKPHKLVLLSEDKNDQVETHYEFSKEDEGSFLSIYEVGKGKNSIFKTLYYKAQSLPLIRSRRSKRLRQRLESIKYLMEGEEFE